MTKGYTTESVVVCGDIGTFTTEKHRLLVRNIEIDCLDDTLNQSNYKSINKKFLNEIYQKQEWA